jgi:hypothetical protein
VAEGLTDLSPQFWSICTMSRECFRELANLGRPVKIGIEPAGQAEGGDAPSRFRRNVRDRARPGKQAAQLDIGRGTLGMHIEWRRVGLDRTLRIIAMLF